MKILTYILAGSAPVIALVMALQLDAQADLISAQKDYISKLNVARDAALSDADFQRTRCEAFYDVVGDYIDVTKQLDALNGKTPY